MLPPRFRARGPAAAASQNAPVVLVNGAASSLGSASLAELTELGVTHVVIVGGTAAVSPSIQSELNARYPGAVTRLGGADRYATSLDVNSKYFSSPKQVYLATGSNFPDALTGGVLAAENHAPILVTPSSCITSADATAFAHWGTTEATLLGGTSALGAGVQNLTTCN